MAATAMESPSAGPSIGGTDSQTIRDRVRARVEVARRNSRANRRELRESFDASTWHAMQVRDELIDRFTLDPEKMEERYRVPASVTQDFNGMVVAAVTLIIGIYVFAQISGTMPTPDNAALANATDAVQGNTGSAFELGAVAIIVWAAVVILGLLGAFGAAGRNGGNGGMGR